MGEHGVCPLHIDWRDAYTRKGVLKGRMKSSYQPYVRMLHSQKTGKKPVHGLWGKKGKKKIKRKIKQPSTY